MKTTIGTRIRLVRTMSGRSQECFAASLGYTRRSLLNWEGGITDPPIAILKPMRDRYDVDPVWLVMGEGETPKVPKKPRSGGVRRADR
ncbi:helix-turn-helix domain-containing protein [Erythrobacter donghaensis]|uniref:helix-turn-helix domain-containing protein n=1 Tax=Erythrobacter donghaensis TaxID=267135 RepID=UPI000AF68349|nr:helix-turn-helix transcriptional regulator [Erythrobacter donghaensis]